MSTGITLDLKSRGNDNPLYRQPFLEHETGTHRECPERLIAIRDELKRTGLIAKCQAAETRLATVDELSRIHGGAYVGRVEQFADEGGGWIEGDTFMSRRSYDVARRAAGTGLAAVDAVIKGPEKQALCLVRPPGHHALVHEAMDFVCSTTSPWPRITRLKSITLNACW